jgi:GAF domain-containing protein
MDKYTIFDQGGTATAVAPARDGNSLVVAAQRDLEAALQLLAERAQYVTGASGASIALREGGEMVCRASAGPAAPEVGVEIETSGLMAESIRTCQLVRCEHAQGDPRVNRESCLELGVESAMVMPLLREQEVVGIFELVADRKSAFDESDVAALARLADMAITAIEHAAAAQRSLPEVSQAEREQALSEKLAPVEPARLIEEDRELPPTTAEPQASVSAEVAQIGSCESCGFPVSQGRTLCVDCEQAGRSAEGKPALFSLTAGKEESWFQAHSYTIGTLVIAALTIALLALKLR